MKVRHRERVLGALYGGRKKEIPVICVNQTGTVEVMEKIGVFWPEAHMNSNKMAKLALAGHTILGFESVRVPFDQTVEAEALGARVKMGGKHEFPEVETPINKSPKEFEFPNEILDKGRVPAVLSAIEMLRKEVGDRVPIISGIVGPFSVAAQAFGIERFLKWTVRNVDYVITALSKITPLLIQYARHQVRYGADIVTIEEMAASPEMLNPKFFEKHVAPLLKEIIESIDVPVILHVCGNATLILPRMIEIRPKAISLDVKTDLIKAKELAGEEVKLVGNISPITVLLQKDVEEVRKAVRKAVERGIDIVAPGCSLSPLTPTENVKVMVEEARKCEEEVAL